jgi:stearoyl-CoA desaturase (delta-9 desaturase)
MNDRASASETTVTKFGRTLRPQHAQRLAAGIDWPVATWLIVIHAGALAAPWTFSWQGLVLMLVLHWVTGGLGICLGYHRLFTHSSFQTSSPMRGVLAIIGGLAGEGPVVDWVANHRKHHALSDEDGDPHSPRDGNWWSHIFWIAYMKGSVEHAEHIAKWAPDLSKSPMMRFVSRCFLLSHFVMASILFGTGWLVGGAAMACSFLVWGLFVRLAFVMHSTWFVNSASHIWGYRNYETTDDSRNSWWVAVLTYGEGWHNNHHAYPRMANHGHKWWEYDLTFRTIRLMQRLGLAWDVVDYKHKNEREAAS